MWCIALVGLCSSYHCYCHLPFVPSATRTLTYLDHSGVTWNLTSDHKLTRLLFLQLSRVLRLLKYPAEDSENPPQVNVHFCLSVYQFVKCTAFTMWCSRHTWVRGSRVSFEITAKPWTRVGPFTDVSSASSETSVCTAGIHMAFASLCRFPPLKPKISFFLPVLMSHFTTGREVMNTVPSLSVSPDRRVKLKSTVKPKFKTLIKLQVNIMKYFK